LLLASGTFSQPDLSHLNYRLPDSVGLNTKYKGDLVELSGKLTAPFSNDIMKVRAIYTWVTDNIAYDCKKFNRAKEPKEIKCRDSADCILKHEKAEWKLISRVAGKGKAVCSGYSLLFKKLCDLAGVRCEVVPGAVRTKYYQLGNNAPEDHAWNAVYLDSNWYFIDATWAAGSVVENEQTGKLIQFVKKQKDLYFLTPYDKHIKNHHPRQAEWYTLLNNTTKETFNRQPFYYNASHYIEYLDNVLPDIGVLKKAAGDTLHFSFEYPFDLEKIQVNTNLKRSPEIWEIKRRHRRVLDTSAVRRQAYWPFKKQGFCYSIDVPVSDKGLYYVEILFLYPGNIEPQKVIRYKVEMI
jgi:hypothetical protein